MFLLVDLLLILSVIGITGGYVFATSFLVFNKDPKGAVVSVLVGTISFLGSVALSMAYPTAKPNWLQPMDFSTTILAVLFLAWAVGIWVFILYYAMKRLLHRQVNHT